MSTTKILNWQMESKKVAILGNEKKERRKKSLGARCKTITWCPRKDEEDQIENFRISINELMKDI